ncbi:hypothetical protein JNUCC74_04650 [Cerasibacillus sp. JNUCC 74]
MAAYGQLKSYIQPTIHAVLFMVSVFIKILSLVEEEIISTCAISQAS